MSKRYYRIAGITLQVDADLPIGDRTFAEKFRIFQVDEPGSDTVELHHHFYIPRMDIKSLGNRVYRKVPWEIYRHRDSWIYFGISSIQEHPDPYQVAVFTEDYSRGKIYNKRPGIFMEGGVSTLTLFPSDQILLAQLLAHRQGCILHAAGMIIEDNGVLFVGHSGAGKSTIVKQLQGSVGVMGDDRMIVRRWADGFRIHGTWSHGEVPLVSSAEAPLKAVILLEKAEKNELVSLQNRQDILKSLLCFVIKPLSTAAWWHKTVDLVEIMTREIAVYRLYFDRSGGVRELISAWWEKQAEMKLK